MMRKLVAALALGVACAGAFAAEIKVLSAGAVEPGMHPFAEQVKRELGHDVKILFNTAPQIAKRLAGGEVYDILILPPALIEQAIRDGKVVAATRVPVGRVGAGVIVRSNAASPNVATADALKQALLGADSVVYNTASSGIYLDKLFEKMGILEQLKPKTTRYANAGSVMEHVIKGTGNEIGLGPITEIRMYEPKGLKLVGPLPVEVQNYTSYEAALMTGSTAVDAATAVLRQLATPASKSLLVKAGVE